MSRASWPWEAPSPVLYESRRLPEVQILTTWVYRVGPLKETKDRRPEDRRSEDRRLEVTNVSRILALGRSTCRIPGGLGAPGGPLKAGKTNVSRILSLGGSKCRILRGLEAPGAPDSNGFLTALRNRVGPLKETKDRIFGSSDLRK